MCDHVTLTLTPCVPSSHPILPIPILYMQVCDHSALEALNTLAERYGELDKRVHFRHLSPDCAALLEAWAAAWAAAPLSLTGCPSALQGQ